MFTTANTVCKQVWESLLDYCYMNWQREKTGISINAVSQIMILKQQTYTRSIYLPLPAQAAQLSGGMKDGWARASTCQKQKLL